MKKKMILAVIIAATMIQYSEAKETVVSPKMVNEALISIAEKNKGDVDINNYNAPTVFNAETVPTLDSYSEKLDNSSKSKTQIDSAKSIADRINSSLQTSTIEDDSSTIDKIVNVDDCVKLALIHHPSIQSYKSSAEIYKSRIAQAWSNYFPQVGVGLEYSRNDMLLSAFDVQKQKYNMFYLPTASVNMLLFDFGKTKAQVDMARKSYQASEFNVKMSINDVIYGVKKSYYNLLYAMQQEKVYTDSVHDYELHLAQANAYYRVGTKAKIDVLTAQYNLGKAKLDLIKAKNNVKLAHANVNNSIGIPEFDNYAIEENLETKTYDVLFTDMIDVAYNTRPEYLAAKKKAEGSAILVKASKRAFLPDLKAFGSLNYGGNNPGKDVGYQFGANLSYSNFNALLLKKQLDESKSTAKKDLADLENERQTVYLEVKQAYIDLQNSKDSIPVAALAMMQAKEQYELASGRYKVGLGDAIELKDAENTYRKAQLEYYSNLMNYNVAAANLERVTGAPILPPATEENSQSI